jgi:hypothetical protein
VPTTIFNGRIGVAIENEFLRVTVLRQGGHIAEIFDKQAGVSPLWTPPWSSREPLTYDEAKHREFGVGSDAKLLAGIMGHNLCLDLFGGPSPEELEAGLTAHGEGSVNQYQIDETGEQLVLKLHLPLAQLYFERHIQLQGRNLKIKESVANLMSFDRPIAWTQHVTLGPPFLEPSTTQFRASVTRSKISETDPGSDAYLKAGAEFDWPIAPRSGGGFADLRQMSGRSPASGYTAHMTNPQHEHAFFVAYSPAFRLSFGYIWRRADFPWLGIWEENCSRKHSPWNGHTVARGMEFGASPMPESRREMVDRGSLFGIPSYRWLAAKKKLEAEYWVITQNANSIPEALSKPTV